MSKHTKGKWRYEPETKTIRSVPANYWLATMNSWDGAVDNEANARYIIQACNNFDELLAVCKEALGFLQRFNYGHGAMAEKLEQAIALAEEGGE